MEVTIDGVRWVVPVAAPEPEPVDFLGAKTEQEHAALEELVWELTAPHTEEEIAGRLGIEARSVRRIQVRALKNLRHFARRGGWESGLSDPRVNHRGIDEHYPNNGMTPRRTPE